MTVSVAVVLFNSPPGLGADVRQTLGALAQSAHFTIDGLERLGTEAATHAEGAVPDQVRQLLRDYNFMAVESRPGQLERIIITGSKRAKGSSADRAHVTTTRIGDHHQVEAILAGPNGVGTAANLIVDTGASTIVLPASMIAELGFSGDQLQDGESQTASGRVRIKQGLLGSVRIGSVVAHNVAVSFIADKRLEGAMLLGMSFLQRFRITIDDGANELILLAK